VYRNVGPSRADGAAAELSLVVAKDGHRRLAGQVALEESSGAYQWAAFAEAVRTGHPANEGVDRAIVAGIRVIEAMARAEKTAATVELEGTTG